MAVALKVRCNSMLFRAFSSSAGGSPASMTTAAYPFLTIPSLVCTTSAVRAGLPAGVPHRRSDTVAAQPEKVVDKSTWRYTCNSYGLDASVRWICDSYEV